VEAEFQTLFLRALIYKNNQYSGIEHLQPSSRCFSAWFREDAAASNVAAGEEFGDEGCQCWQ
jgi:hypothetical protein